MTGIALYGADYSVYVRIARLVLEELAIAHKHMPVDIFAETRETATFKAAHPFGKIPALEHDGWNLYETDAIAHYLIALHGDSTLMPVEPRSRARTVQIMRIMDNYAYPSLVWGVYVEELEAGLESEKLKESRSQANWVLRALDDLMRAPFLVGPHVTLADLWAYPMFVLFGLSTSGRTMIADFPRLEEWMDRMADTSAARATRFPVEVEANG